MIRDQVNAEICARAGIELLRAVALTPKARGSDKFSREWVIQWGRIFEGNMEYMARELINWSWREYRSCFKAKEHDEALGLAIVLIELLRAAIKYRIDSAASTMLPFIESGFHLITKGHDDHGTSMGLPTFQFKGTGAQHLGAIFCAITGLFATAEDVHPGYLNALALNILEFTVVVLGSDSQNLLEVVNQQVEQAGQIADEAERERQLIEILKTIIVFLEVALCTEGVSPDILLALRKLALGRLAELLPDFMDTPDFARYKNAARYLKSDTP
ncbi:hypothetical protein ONZ43_g717 [Nemania bipapillata]|uniref:Uncharacterized protein n=1 Tax=Nemania bipapillata TaxID=110536 RepID=A0ACC2J7B1_9PEZI|nr:hypothetical protein ONZ43_g717 [Nemania bipapillata]